MSWGRDFTQRMRDAAPMKWLTLEELCEAVGVDKRVMFYSPPFGAAMEKLIELRILDQQVYQEPETGAPVECYKLLHPNLWEEVVGSLKSAEARIRLGRLPSQSDFATYIPDVSGEIDNSIQSG